MLSRFWPLTALVGGVLLGAADLLLQITLPYPWANLANSSAVWAIGAFFLGRLLARNWWQTALAGLILLPVAVESYYLTATLVLNDDLSNAWSPIAFLWMAFGVLAGPLFAVAGRLSVTANHRLLRAAAVAMPGAVLLAEAAITIGRGHALGDSGTLAIKLALGALLTLLLARGLRGRLEAVGLGLGLAAVGAVAFRLGGF